MMDSRDQRLLSSRSGSLVIALNEIEVGKLFSGDTRSDIGSEAEKMKYANAINTLVVNFIRLEYNDELNRDMLVMERTVLLNSVKKSNG